LEEVGRREEGRGLTIENVLPRIHPMRLRIAKPFYDPEYIFELKYDINRELRQPLTWKTYCFLV
jgi:hypothetical protein